MSAPVTEPLSWLAVQYIKSLMATVAPAAGYDSDFTAPGVRLLDDRSQIDAASGPYVLVVSTDFEPGAESGTRNSSSYRESMGVLIEFGVERDPDTTPELQAHRARTDVIRALRQPLRGQLQGLTQIVIEGSSIGDAPENFPLIIAQVTARAALTDTTPPAS
jgi:hypothetical protein